MRQFKINGKIGVKIAHHIQCKGGQCYSSHPKVSEPFLLIPPKTVEPLLLITTKSRVNIFPTYGAMSKSGSTVFVGMSKNLPPTFGAMSKNYSLTFGCDEQHWPPILWMWWAILDPNLTSNSEFPHKIKWFGFFFFFLIFDVLLWGKQWKISELPL